ncbi:Thioredoxin domain-containing protein [Rozella allomycis CSF55]|uniref:Thioredoxin domain-containing protein n=1 Tax=Rozella allomycis (strain CSF55) TaxID=988480 RepID=A0A075ATE8_ROZAC|nr:Thioredoxin domain-containing protein [Rozella allomycis CSF55]|eukprot:EPZ33445.1 Thioredoxin domain-containing protein [Rozella allomycis CSF55]
MKPLTFIVWALHILVIYTEIIEIDPQSFSSSISERFHLVKYYSPDCIHCQEFRPIYEQFDEKIKKNESLSSTLKLNQVNCKLHNEFCRQMNVNGLPTIILYKQGKPVSEFEDYRTVEKLTEFIEKNVNEDHDGGDTDLPVNPGHLIEINTKNVNQIKEGRWFIKFFAPWCGHCKSLAPTWTELAEKATNVNVGDVDCESFGDICRKYGINGYPTLIYIERDYQSKYSGARKLEDLLKFIEENSKPFFKSVAKIEEIENEKGTRFVLVNPTEDFKRRFKNTALKYRTMASFYIFNNSNSKSTLNVYKGKNPITFEESNKLENWIKDHYLPITSQFILEDNKKWIVLLIVKNSEILNSLELKFKSIAENFDRDVLFCYMNANLYSQYSSNVFNFDSSYEWNLLALNPNDEMFYKIDEIEIENIKENLHKAKSGDLFNNNNLFMERVNGEPN